MYGQYQEIIHVHLCNGMSVINAGFTDGKPWINVNQNYKYINVKASTKR